LKGLQATAGPLFCDDDNFLPQTLVIVAGARKSRSVREKMLKILARQNFSLRNVLNLQEYHRPRLLGVVAPTAIMAVPAAQTCVANTATTRVGDV
jgi:hypothetical protein